MKLPVQAIRPGMTVLVASGPRVVTRVTYAMSGGQQAVSITTMGQHETTHWAHEEVDVVPPAPKLTSRWNRTHDRYDIHVEVEGAVRVHVNNTEVWDGAIQVPSERGDAVKELS